MKTLIKAARRLFLIAGAGWLVCWAEPLLAQTNSAIRIVELGGTVDIFPHDSKRQLPAATNVVLEPMDRIRTGPNSSVSILWSDNSVLRFGELTELEIQPSDASQSEHGLHLIRGLLSFFHRGKPGRIRVISSGGFAGIEGTEFVMEAGGAGTKVFVIDGKVRFGNEAGTLPLTNGDSAALKPGRAPIRTSGFVANNVLQWCFYYPGVLDLNDLKLTDAEKSALAESLAAYRDGDLPAALAKYPSMRIPGSDAERVYHAALLLGMSEVAEAESALSNVAGDISSKNVRLSAALRTLIAAVKRQSYPAAVPGESATENLAASYFEQSQAVVGISLEAALGLARDAVKKDSGFGFGWERVAELEFSFGRIKEASEALARAIELSPRNAEALALQGFLLAARNNPREGIVWFDRALGVDSALGNAWLGRGLCRIRLGNLRGGREDLLVAAAMEPQRALLRSYLAKAWSESGSDMLSIKELDRAKVLDPGDPTAWLYSALINEQNNRINEAVHDLEKSQDLNTNRAIYRSKLLLDQDSAVRSANLARIYDEAGLDDVAVREASRAVAADYENFSAHMFLANSYDQVNNNAIDPRYEAPTFSEYLIASLLGPADGRILAQPVTQQEYTSLFERDTFGVSSSTGYLSRGEWDQYTAQYGTFRDSSYAVESDYSWDPGQTPNGHEEIQGLSIKVKQILTPEDSVFVQVEDSHRKSGDLTQRYDPNQADTSLSVDEKQDPTVLVGLNHQWSQTERTLFLASIIDDTLSVSDPFGETYLLGSKLTTTPVDLFTPLSLADTFQNRLTMESFELQQLSKFSSLQSVAGIRLQLGTYRLVNGQGVGPNTDPSYLLYLAHFSGVYQSLVEHSFRITPYMYETWEVVPGFYLIGGAAYDYQSLPENQLFAPLTTKGEIEDRFSPKAGLVWQPEAGTVVRAAYTQSLGGANLDPSVRLEPTQLAGFVQGFQTLMPASLVGGVDGERFQTGDVSFERQFARNTYVALSAEWLHSSDEQAMGALSSTRFPGDPVSIQLPEGLKYQETSVDLSLHQLVGDYFGFAARYRVAASQLSAGFSQVNPGLANTSTNMAGVLQLLTLDATFEHPSGFFAMAEAQWWKQDLAEDVSYLRGDGFWQVNLEAGYRSPKRRVEVTLGLLNVNGQNYNLLPINFYSDPVRQRTLAARLQLNF